MAVGVFPAVGPVGESVVGPAVEGLGSVVGPAEGGQVVGSGLAGWGSAVFWSLNRHGFSAALM